MVRNARFARYRNSSANDYSHRSLHPGNYNKKVKINSAQIKIGQFFQIWEQSTVSSDVEMS